MVSFSGVMAVAGLVAGLPLGILGVLPNKNTAPDPLSEGNSIVRLGIGLKLPEYDSNTTDWYTGQDMGGALPRFRVFNARNEFIGRSHGHKEAEDGQWASVEIIQNGTGRGQQATSLELRGAEGDPTCISYIAHTWSDGTKVGWLGDMGLHCGKHWYHSLLYVQTSNGGLHNPKCTWFGGNGSTAYYNFPTGMRINTQRFGRLNGDGNDYTLPPNTAELCWPPNTEWFLEPEPQTSSGFRRTSPLNILQILVFAVDTVRASVLKSRQSSGSSEGSNTSWQSTLIGSNHTTHSAKTLCDDSNSWGPDFVSFEEGVFCDMTTKKTWPLCDDATARHCYDWSSHSLVGGGLFKREMKYAKVEVWD